MTRTVDRVTQWNLVLLALRLVFGVFMAVHGLNKFRGLDGTAKWFAGIGMRWPAVQARLAATTEVGAGLLLAAGLLTPLASAGIIAVMLVAIRVAHWTTGFFVFHEGQGWEYCGAIATVVWCIATVGPGEWSLDHALDITFSGWTGAVVAAAVGIGGAVLQLAISYRPAVKA